MIRRNSVLLTLCVAMATVAAAVVLSACGGGGGESVSLTPGEPQVLFASQLSDFAAEQPESVYWLGVREGAKYEVTETPQGRIYIRYLTGGAEAGDPRAKFLTVGTYPGRDGAAALRAALANRGGAKLVRTDDGALLLVDPVAPQSAHLAYPARGFRPRSSAPSRGPPCASPPLATCSRFRRDNLWGPAKLPSRQEQWP